MRYGVRLIVRQFRRPVGGSSSLHHLPACNNGFMPIRMMRTFSSTARPGRPDESASRKNKINPSKFPGPFSKTKIVATIGPSSQSYEMIEKLWKAGVDVFRVNLSHGSHDTHRKVIENIRKLEANFRCSTAILLDLQGPKLRVGTFRDGPVFLEKGSKFTLDMKDQPGDTTRVTLPHPEIFAAITPKTTLLLDDGKVKLQVIRCGKDFAETEVVVAGKLSERKGVNVPDATLPISALTEKDKKDALFGVKMEVDWMALSFVQRAEDIVELRDLLGETGGDRGAVKIMAKIEKPSAVADLERISEEVDAVMVARGDLGVELSPHKVPIVQKRIVSLMRHIGKPVVVATQMLESMIKLPTPTRAEANDVANAIYDGADAVMLSAESAAGDFPMESVETMEAIIKEVEASPEYAKRMESYSDRIRPTQIEAMIPAARTLARDLEAAAIVCLTKKGRIAQFLSKERSTRPILALCHSKKTSRYLLLSWGVYPMDVHTACARVDFLSGGAEEIVTYKDNSLEKFIQIARAMSIKAGLAETGDLLVVTGWQPGGVPGANTLRIVRVVLPDVVRC